MHASSSKYTIVVRLLCHVPSYRRTSDTHIHPPYEHILLYSKAGAAVRVMPRWRFHRSWFLFFNTLKNKNKSQKSPQRGLSNIYCYTPRTNNTCCSYWVLVSYVDSQLITWSRSFKADILLICTIYSSSCCHRYGLQLFFIMFAAGVIYNSSCCRRAGAVYSALESRTGLLGWICITKYPAQHILK